MSQPLEGSVPSAAKNDPTRTSQRGNGKRKCSPLRSHDTKKSRATIDEARTEQADEDPLEVCK